MEKIKQKTMNLNRETAMRLWNKSYGKESKATDFSGRIMAKGAYNDRNSEFGWNVDHILPQSKGGITADHNLVCCHIKTNNEKADSFPCFNANKHSFEIIKVQNHYEIRAKDKQEKTSPQDIDLFDSAAGIRLFKSLKAVQDKERFVGTVYICLQSVSNSSAVINFIKKIFNNENISYKKEPLWEYWGGNSSPNIDIIVTDYDMPLKSDVSELLDKCILLNTYLFCYFLQLKEVLSYSIHFKLTDYDTSAEMYKKVSLTSECNSNENALFINKLVWQRTEAKNNIKWIDNSNGYNKYDYHYTNLAKHLDKEVNGK